MNISIQAIYDLLYSCYGETGWWPAESPDEVVMGTILTQNTSWRNVEVSLEKMKASGILTLQDLAIADVNELANVVRSSGFYRQKSSRLVNISRAIIERYGNLEHMKEFDTAELQIFLSALNGVGQETMDCILLYVLDKPEFVVDKYTLRIFSRIGISNISTIRETKKMVENAMQNDVPKLKNLHGMLVELAKSYCRANPQCENCPLMEKCDYGLEAN